MHLYAGFTSKSIKSVVLAIALSGMWAAQAAETEKLSYPQKDTPEAALIRGENVFKHYCVLCHGATGEGNGRAAFQYNPKPANLVKSPFPPAYKEMIIRRGGEAVGRSRFMPPWGQELTDEQIKDLLVFLGSIVKKE